MGLPQQEFAELREVVRQSSSDLILDVKGGVLRRDVFERLDTASRALARMLKSVEFVPKSLLQHLSSAHQALVNEAPYCGGAGPEMRELAARVEQSLWLIIHGESHEDHARIL